MVAIGLKRRWADSGLESCYTVQGAGSHCEGLSRTPVYIGSLLCARYLLKSQVLLTGTHADPVVGNVPVFQRRNRRLGRLVSAPKGTMTLGCRAGLSSLHAGSTRCPPSPPGLGAGELGTSLPNSPEAGLLVVSSNWSGGSHFYLKYLLV